MLAIVLARNNTREFDQMISLYTQECGKVDALAKGIKKIISKNSANLKVFSLVDVEITKGKGVDHLTKVQSINIFKDIYIDFDKIFIAGYVIKLANDNLLTGEPDKRIFDLLLSFLDFLNSAEHINSLNLATGFIFKFWHYLGFSQQESECEVWLEESWKGINNFDLDKKQEIHDLICQKVGLSTGRKVVSFFQYDFV